jgi:hypothetical protein
VAAFSGASERISIDKESQYEKAILARSLPGAFGEVGNWDISL